MERLWLTDCAYLLTKPDHWFCPQRCAVLDGDPAGAARGGARGLHTAPVCGD